MLQRRRHGHPLPLGPRFRLSCQGLQLAERGDLHTCLCYPIISLPKSRPQPFPFPVAITIAIPVAVPVAIPRPERQWLQRLQRRDVLLQDRPHR